MNASGSIFQYSIKVQGIPLPNTFPLTNFSIVCNRQSSKATLSLNTPMPDNTGEINSYNSDFTLGYTVDILAGYDGLLAPVFKGTVSQHTFKAGELGQQVLIYCTGATPPPAALNKAGNAMSITYGQNILKIELNKSTGIKGQVSVPGSNLYLPGNNISVKGLSNLYNGSYHLTVVEHEFADGNWISTLHIERG